MTDPLVTVLREQKVKGWPDDDGKEPRADDKAYVLPLSRALSRTYKTDAHLAQYVTPNGRRMKTAAASQEDIAVQMHVIVFDVDCEASHGKGVATPISWRAEVRERVLALVSAHPGAVYYDTKGGARIIYRLPIPHVITCPEDALQWKQDYAITAAYLRRVFGVEADMACADWTRLFRLPFATRQPGGEPEKWDTSENFDSVASLWFEPTDEDHALARELLPRAFEERAERPFTPYTGGDGYGVFFHALRARGHIVRPHGRNGYVIRCPNHEQHSSGRIGDRSTLLYTPSNSSESLGWINCLHGHCQHQKPRDWLRMFADHEISAAQAASGRK